MIIHLSNKLKNDQLTSPVVSSSTDCDGTLTAPGEIKPLMNGAEYFGGLNCAWRIQAPSDKSIVLRFESFELEYSYRYPNFYIAAQVVKKCFTKLLEYSRCMYDNIQVYDSATADSEKRLAMLCGNLTQHLPVLRSASNSMLVEFHADESRHYKGFSAKVHYKC